MPPTWLWVVWNGRAGVWGDRTEPIIVVSTEITRDTIDPINFFVDVRRRLSDGEERFD